MTIESRGRGLIIGSEACLIDRGSSSSRLATAYTGIRPDIRLWCWIGYRISDKNRILKMIFIGYLIDRGSRRAWLQYLLGLIRISGKSRILNFLFDGYLIERGSRRAWLQHLLGLVRISGFGAGLVTGYPTKIGY